MILQCEEIISPGMRTEYNSFLPNTVVFPEHVGKYNNLGETNLLVAQSIPLA
jgi:hypothetical protein